MEPLKWWDDRKEVRQMSSFQLLWFLLSFILFLLITQVLDGNANITIGTYVPTLERINLMSYSVSYMQHSFIFAFSQNDLFATPLARLMAPFQNYVWISITFLISISIVVILLTKMLPTKQRHFIIGGHVNRTPILNMMNALIGNVIPNRRLAHRKYFGTFARTLTILWIFFWLIVRNSYQGSMYEFLQSQRVKSPYDTVEKVRSSNVNIYMASPAANLIPVGFNCAR